MPRYIAIGSVTIEQRIFCVFNLLYLFGLLAHSSYFTRVAIDGSSYKYHHALKVTFAHLT